MRTWLVLVLVGCHGGGTTRRPHTRHGSACQPASYVDGPTFGDPAPPVVDPAVHAIAHDRLAITMDSAPASSWSIAVGGDSFAPTAVAVKSRAAALTTDTWPYGSVPTYEAVLELGRALVPGAS